MTREEIELTINYLEEMQNNYIEGYGYEAHPLPEYYAIESAIKLLRAYLGSDCVIIHTNGLDEGIKCAMCTNSMKGNTGCDGGCAFDETMYEKIMNVIKELTAESDVQTTKEDEVKCDPFNTEPEPDWIPTSERLPSDYGEYLCTLKGEHNTGFAVECCFTPYGRKSEIGGWSTCEADGFVKLSDEEVIAWMPMPKLYEEH